MEWLGILSGIQQNFVIYFWFALSVFLLIKFLVKPRVCQFFWKSNWTNFIFYCMSQLTVSGQLGGPGQHARSRAVVALSRVRARVPTLHHNTMGVHVQIPLHQPKPAILTIARVSVIIFYGIILKTPSSHVHYVMMFAFPYSRWGVEQLGLLGHVHRHLRRRNTG